jgi:hypothetical protein
MISEKTSGTVFTHQLKGMLATEQNHLTKIAHANELLVEESHMEHSPL